MVLINLETLLCVISTRLVISITRSAGVSGVKQFRISKAFARLSVNPLPSFATVLLLYSSILSFTTALTHFSATPSGMEGRWPSWGK